MLFAQGCISESDDVAIYFEEQLNLLRKPEVIYVEAAP